jgi:hypothetical protein
MSFQVAKGIGLSATKKDLEKAFGEASKNDYSDYSVLSYGNEYEYTVQSKFYVYDKKAEYNKIQLTNMPETLVEYTETALEAPAYLAQYTAPSSLGDDLLSGSVKIGGDLYRFPAPVSEFLKNGWTVRSRPGFVGAYQINTMTLEKGGLILDLSIENLAEVQTTAENCAAYGAQIKADSGLSYELPRGVMLGAAGSVLDGLDVKFSTSDSKEYTSYTAYDSKAGVNLTIQVGKENHQIITITFRKTNWDQ